MTPKFFLLITIFCLTLVGLSAKVAHAQTTSDELSRVAEGHYQSGMRHFEEGEYAAAADAFRQAYTLTPVALLLYNIAVAEWRSGNLESARAAALRAERGQLAPPVAAKNRAMLRAIATLSRSEAFSESLGQRSDGAPNSDSMEDVKSGRASERPQATTWFWVGATATGVGALALAGVAWSSHRIAQEEQNFGRGRASDEQVLESIESHQRLGIGLLIGGLAATAVGATIVALNWPETPDSRFTLGASLAPGIGGTLVFSVVH